MNYFISKSRAPLDRFWNLHRNLSKSNSKFENKHTNEVCFIFANGGSLKYYDIGKITDELCISCTFSLIDTRMQALSPDYNFFTDSYLFYPIVYNSYPFMRKFQLNEFEGIFKDLIDNNVNTQFFCNTTNFYALGRKKNINYFHHYGSRGEDSVDLSNNFSSSGGALEIMIGAAKFMGVRKCYLFGCDYLLDYPLQGHFYADYVPFDGPSMPEYRHNIKMSFPEMELIVVRPEFKACSDFKSVTFEDHFGIPKIYTENIEYIEDSILEKLRKACTKKQIMMTPF